MVNLQIDVGGDVIMCAGGVDPPVDKVGFSAHLE
jgi:hypothetical protein